MSEERKRLLERREIISAYVTVLERSEKLLQVCASVDGDGIDDAIAAVVEAFGVSAAAAEAILVLQVRRFTPSSIRHIRDELTDIDRRLQAG